MTPQWMMSTDAALLPLHLCGLPPIGSGHKCTGNDEDCHHYNTHCLVIITVWMTLHWMAGKLTTEFDKATMDSVKRRASGHTRNNENYATEEEEKITLTECCSMRRRKPKNSRSMPKTGKCGFISWPSPRAIACVQHHRHTQTHRHTSVFTSLWPHLMGEWPQIRWKQRRFEGGKKRWGHILYKGFF